MNNVPLIQGNSTQEINTSIIALKKAAKELEDLNTLVNQKLAEVNEALSKEINDVNTSLSEEIDNVNTSLSGDISDLQDTISALDLSQVGGSGYYIESISQTDGQVSASAQAIADSVTSDNVHSVSSKAVYNAINLTFTNLTITNLYSSYCAYNSNMQVAIIKNGVLYFNLTFLFSSAVTIADASEFILFDRVLSANAIISVYVGGSPIFAYIRQTALSDSSKSSVVLKGGVSVTSGKELNIVATIPLLTT